MNKPSLRGEHRRLTRERIIDAARRLFRDIGYVAASMEEIAREGGVSRTTLYQHYPSKTAIMDAILDVEVPRFVGILEHLPEGLLDRPQVDRLIRLMQKHYRDNAEFVAFLRQAVVSEDRIAQRIDQSYRSAIEILLRHLPVGRGSRMRCAEVTRTRIYICLSAADSMLERCLHAEWTANRDIVVSELVALWCSMFDIPDAA